MPYNLSFYHHRYLAILLYYLSSMLLQIRPESSCLLWFSFFSLLYKQLFLTKF
nr:MAG TPA: hypothetical protein [Caudoviricetes sp.]DAX53190.1 MAG TPA: hypothetical protein [Caudoviricetes sp.]DAY62869.1 MAG TPA: hypothetical protein [Caudoviricetes sp.]